jgi:hypothetical protein
MDEVFGSENFVSQIAFTKQLQELGSSGLTNFRLYYLVC